MRIVLDACVLFPTVMREVILGAARLGAFEPVWSDRILEEWARAARKIGPTGETQARGEIALLRAAWPQADHPPAPGIEARLWLPDPADTHVLAVAVDSSADAIMTLNTKDFPRNVLAEEGLSRIDPDAYLLSVWQGNPHGMAQVGDVILAQARTLSGEDWTLRALFKKARLPRLAKAMAA